MTEEGKKFVKKNIAGWIGIVLLVYAAITLATSFWSPEAYQTAGMTNIYGSAAAGIIGIVLIVVWLATKGR